MERSEIRGGTASVTPIPDCASLNPGYALIVIAGPNPAIHAAVPSDAYWR
jgi:hypothetical protein